MLSLLRFAAWLRGLSGRRKTHDLGPVGATVAADDATSDNATYNILTSDTPTYGRVHALLEPRGLVDIDGVLEPAWWVGGDPRPARGDGVVVVRSATGTWLAARDPGALA